MPKKILTVEDEAVNSIVLEKTLRELGYDVAGNAFDAEEAIAMARDEKPDLILMDIRIQGEKDGIEAAKEIYALYNIPIIYLTAHSDDETIKRAVESGPFGYLIKPFKEKELYSNIEMTIHKHKIYNAAAGVREQRPADTTVSRQTRKESAVLPERNNTAEDQEKAVVPVLSERGVDPKTYSGWILSAIRYPVFLFDTAGLLVFSNKAGKNFLYKTGIADTSTNNLSIRQFPDFMQATYNRNQAALQKGRRISVTGTHTFQGRNNEITMEMQPLIFNNTLSYISVLLLPIAYNRRDTAGEDTDMIPQYFLSDLINRLREIQFLASPEDNYRFRKISLYCGEVVRILSDLKEPEME
ncbi:MAG: response regulator [Methanospirillaceae archaeon]|nr:response regulator [Methanospirillaceae archaeon]